MEIVRSDIKRLIMSLQKYVPSELNTRIVEFALKESRRIQEGKEMEMDAEEAEDGADEEVQ
jgi:hypothetical protein